MYGLEIIGLFLLGAAHAEDIVEDCDIEIVTTLEDPDWTPESGETTSLVLTLHNRSARPQTLSWEDNCPCGMLPGTTPVSIQGLPAVPSEDPTCEAARQAMLMGCANMGACQPGYPLPSITLQPGENKPFPVTVPLNPAGLACVYGPIDGAQSWELTAALSVYGSARTAREAPSLNQTPPQDGARLCSISAITVPHR